MTTPVPSVSVNRINFCTVNQLKFELCEDSVCKKAASDNKTSAFSKPSICRKAVAGPVAPDLKKQVQQPDFTLSEFKADHVRLIACKAATATTFLGEICWLRDMHASSAFSPQAGHFPLSVHWSIH